MTALLVAGLLAGAWTVLILPASAMRGHMRIPADSIPARTATDAEDDRAVRTGTAGRRVVRRLYGSAPVVDLHELPLFVHQLAGLLRAGRPPRVLWADMERVHAQGHTTFSRMALPVVARARRAAELGLSVPAALSDAAVQDVSRRHAGADPVNRLWIDLAGCLEVAERSGAPLAGILEHYAAQLDAQLDGNSARDTALAGPRATVVLLAWLPVVGLVLGFALGINPVEVLLASPLGRFALAAGASFMLAGRVWSRRLVRRAGGGTSQ